MVPVRAERSDLKRDYRGAEEGVGAVYEWSGNAKAGAGVMTITAATANKVDIHLRFLRPFKAESQHRLTWRRRVRPRTSPGP